MYRVFGSPYTIGLHQQLAYLRLKGLPHKVYCSNITTSMLYSFYFRSRTSFCTLTPTGTSQLQMWQLAESAEMDPTVEAPALREISATPSEGTALVPRRGRRMLINKRTHPKLHVACWATVVYASWWLSKTGAMYRWILGDSYDVVEGYLRFFFILPGVGLARTAVPHFRRAMAKLLLANGVSKDSAPFMDEHFKHICKTLDEHFEQHPQWLYLLGTPHPTLADVTLGSSFSAFFLMDDPPATTITEQFPNLWRYLGHVTGRPGSTSSNSDRHADEADEGEKDLGHVSHDSEHMTADYPDSVPASLTPFFEAILQVLPFLVGECDAFSSHMSSSAVQTMKREPLEGPWKGCSAYLFPQMSKVQSIMMVDEHIFSICSRSQDLELALLAAREVWDETLEDFGRTRGTAGAPSAATNERSSKLDCAQSGKAIAARDEDAMKEGEEEVDVAEEVSGFYRVYTKRAAIRHNAVTLSQATRRRHVGSAAKTVPTDLATVDDVVLKLKEMLGRMRCPQYTLTSVCHGRRVYVAAIPEYEMAKIRKSSPSTHG